ncbi:AAA family ATPase [Campylobacter helveticus]|uniref:AAA family ATPase n=1 Tax=Campylobacter helveticus TaxID=28898 RepID=UPI0022EA828B|nr:AAA family ATPase [Campylobacter helveticus]
MPVRKTIDSLNLFNEELKIICDDTLKMELNCVTLLCGKSEMGKSFLALKACANALNENYKPFFWSLEDRDNSLLDRIKNINSFYPFTINSFEFSNELPVLDKKLSPEENLFKELQSLSDCDLIVLDTFSVFFSFFGFKDQNNQNDVQSFFNVLTQLAMQDNQAILLLHHLDKKGESIMGSSVITNVPRNIYQLDFPRGENKNTTTYRILKIIKDSNNINAGEREKPVKVLENKDINEPAMRPSTESYTEIQKIQKNDIAVIDNNNGYVTMHENRGVFYLSSRNILSSEFYQKFEANGRQAEFKMMNANGSSYAINLKNSLLTQTHRSILDAIFLYVKDNVDSRVIKQHQENFWDMQVFLEPYRFLKYYLKRSPSAYSWLKEKLGEISRFAYDLSYVRIVGDKEEILKERDKGILNFDSIERIQKENNTFISVFVLTIRREYIKRLHTESTLAYEDNLAQILVNLDSLVAQDLVRFLTSFPDKKILTFKDFCEIKAYKSYKDKAIISRQKKELIKAKDELINFGINVYGKNVPFEEYDDEILADRYKDENDLIFVYESNNKVRRFIKKNDPMNRLNIKNNKFINNKEPSLFDEQMG